MGRLTHAIRDLPSAHSPPLAPAIVVWLLCVLTMPAGATAAAVAGQPPGTLLYASGSTWKAIDSAGVTTVVPLPRGAKHLALSPGGRRVAYVHPVDGVPELWTMYLDGLGRLRVSYSRTAKARPAWSPTGERLIFVRGRRLYETPAGGGHSRRLVRGGGTENAPAWSPQGALAFIRRGELHLLDKRRRAQATGVAGAADPSWSPDGRYLAYTTHRGTQRDIYMMDRRSRHRRALAATSADEREPAWTPDGRHLVYTTGVTGRRRLIMAALDGSPPQPLLVGEPDAHGAQWRPEPSPVLGIAGDIACDPGSEYRLPPYDSTGAFCEDARTAQLLYEMDLDAILLPGDLQYEDGTYQKFQRSFDRSWGPLKPLMRPVPGNHEYATAAAAGYFDYFNGPGLAFGQAGQRGRGYYSFDVGTWHVIGLNSMCKPVGGCGPDSPQMRWLERDLAAHPARCTLAFWHHPRFSSGGHGSALEMDPVWRTLHHARVDIVVNGHDHLYERFAPQNPAGRPDPAGGLRQFTVGTGGKEFHRATTPLTNSESLVVGVYGVLRLTLRDAGYEWRFIQTQSRATRDRGRATCH